jgi:hypothetical protein
MLLFAATPHNTVNSACVASLGGATDDAILELIIDAADPALGDRGVVLESAGAAGSGARLRAGALDHPSFIPAYLLASRVTVRGDVAACRRLVARIATAVAATFTHRGAAANWSPQESPVRLETLESATPLRPSTSAMVGSSDMLAAAVVLRRLPLAPPPVVFHIPPRPQGVLDAAAFELAVEELREDAQSVFAATHVAPDAPPLQGRPFGPGFGGCPTLSTWAAALVVAAEVTASAHGTRDDCAEMLWRAMHEARRAAATAARKQLVPVVAATLQRCVDEAVQRNVASDDDSNLTVQFEHLQAKARVEFRELCCGWGVDTDAILELEMVERHRQAVALLANGRVRRAAAFVRALVERTPPPPGGVALSDAVVEATAAVSAAIAKEPPSMCRFLATFCTETLVPLAASIASSAAVSVPAAADATTAHAVTISNVSQLQARLLQPSAAETAMNSLLADLTTWKRSLDVRAAAAAFAAANDATVASRDGSDLSAVENLVAAAGRVMAVLAQEQSHLRELCLALEATAPTIPAVVPAAAASPKPLSTVARVPDPRAATGPETARRGGRKLEDAARAAAATGLRRLAEATTTSPPRPHAPAAGDDGERRQLLQTIASLRHRAALVEQRDEELVALRGTVDLLKARLRDAEAELAARGEGLEARDATLQEAATVLQSAQADLDVARADAAAARRRAAEGALACERLERSVVEARAAASAEASRVRGLEDKFLTACERLSVSNSRQADWSTAETAVSDALRTARDQLREQRVALHETRKRCEELHGAWLEAQHSCEEYAAAYEAQRAHAARDKTTIAALESRVREFASTLTHSVPLDRLLTAMEHTGDL